MFPRLLPRETSFFDYFDRHIALTVTGASELVELVSRGGDLTARAVRIKEIEHETDVITHQCVEALHKTFITPLDRNEIHRLISRMDDVMDFIDGAAGRMLLYEITEMTPEARELAAILSRSTIELQHAVNGLRKMRNVPLIRQKCIVVNQLENDADVVLRAALAKLFKTERDPVRIIKWKEIYEIMEGATDRCEDVANTIEGVVLEHD
jgi:predicted phosphate transport protein (TIGR00153 family)